MDSQHQPTPPPAKKRFAEGSIVIHDQHSAWIKRDGKMVPYNGVQARQEARANG